MNDVIYCGAWKKINQLWFVKMGTGILLNNDKFNSGSILETSKQIIANKSMINNAKKLGDELTNQGGYRNILNEIMLQL